MSAIDLRSDTVTRPTPAMRRAIAEAEVGDDVFGDDPTVLALEKRCAELAGKAAALYVPSGTMANQLAVNVLTQPGNEVLLESESHIFLYEQGGIAANSGCLAHLVPGERGALDPAALVARLRPASDDHAAKLALVCVENTHNRAGGAIVPLAKLRAMADTAREHGVRVHLDGARLWNAAVASGVSIAEWAACADTAMMCFSKGLGAPVGSILVGGEAEIRQARRVRKRWGGGMRQAGILAAACLHALDHHVARLAEDHARAKRLAAGMRMDGVEVGEPDTNIVIARLAAPLDPAKVLAELEKRGVRMVGFGTGRIRAICHLDVDDAGVERAIGAFGEAVRASR
ncbi:MAG: aminotransferase class I/II-fold pyridoxal phosphate-dependent enzyme [Candidatus Eisenbacteria bacterium]|nr:aminotransferase class I/II-fold pyridoxal phosphate-dependent enzyme [Candidatus Eisenbacteria bacterium]